MTKIGFYFQANEKIGGGHFWRCFNFAKNIKNINIKIFFISTSLDKNYLEILSKENFSFIEINKINNFSNLKKIICNNKIKILVSDSYVLSYKNQKQIKRFINKFIIIDDRANKKHYCDILINNNFLNKNSIQQIKKLNKDSILLLGTNFFILNKKKTKKLKTDVNKIRKIFIFFGSADRSNLTSKILMYLTKFKDLKLDIVLGSLNKNFNKINNYYNSFQNIRIFHDISNDKIYEIMKKNDLAIGSGGVNLYERLFLGLPSIVISNAENQLESNTYLSQKKIIEYLGKDKNLTKKKFLNSFKNVLSIRKYRSLVSKTNHYFSSHKNNNLFTKKIKKILNINVK